MLISLTGPSGVGKGVLKDYLFTRLPHLFEVAWYTTRTNRPDEGHRKDRVPVTQEEFRRLEKEGQLTLIQELYGFRYGVRLNEQTLKEGRVAFLELQVGNILPARALFGELVSVGLVPTDLFFLKRRLLNRGSESRVQIENRLELAREEIQQIQRNSSLFVRIFEVSANNEDQILELVGDFIQSILKGGTR